MNHYDQYKAELAAEKEALAQQKREELLKIKTEAATPLFIKVMKKAKPHQLEILQLISEGHTSKEIADLVYLDIRTVEGYRYALQRKTESRSVPHLVSQAIRHGFIK